jgi:fatty acid desaturase
VCGDCCVLTEGGARVWAICLGCEARRGRSLRRAWLRFLLWLALPLAALAFIVALLEWLSLRAG